MGLFSKKRSKKSESHQAPQLAADDPRLKALFDLMLLEKVFNIPLNVRTHSFAAEEAIFVTDSGKKYLKVFTRDPNKNHSDEEVIWGGAEGYKVVEMSCLMEDIDGIIIDDECIIPMSFILLTHLMSPPIPGFQPNKEVTQEQFESALLRESLH